MESTQLNNSNLDLESLKHKHFLIADDLEGSRVLGTLFLKLAGAEVSVVTNGCDAVRRALKRDYDAVLMDIHMPEMNGLEAIEKLRAEGYQNPIVVVSSDTADAVKEKATELGANSYLEKPFKLSGLIEVLKNALAEQVKHHSSQPQESGKAF